MNALPFISQTIEASAVIAGAIYGVLLARQNNMDIVGAFSLAFILSFGGGTLRDLLLDRHPLFWIKAPHYPVVVFGITIIISYFYKTPGKMTKLLNIPDAFGLGLFSISSTIVSLECGTSYFVASLLGVVAGTFGGVIGDIICNRVPSLFSKETTLYATCAFCGNWVYLLLKPYDTLTNIVAPLSIIFIVIFRFLALKNNWNWSLPEPQRE